MTEAFIGLGSNLDDRLEALRRALEGIAGFDDTAIVTVSNAVESVPWGVTDQPPFANAVARVATSIPADRFLGLLKELEVALGRVAGQRYGPRAIDLDILLFGDDEWVTPELTVPHPRLAEREFAVVPLLEIAPHATWPDGSPIDRARATEGRILRVLGPVPGFAALTPAPPQAGSPQPDAPPYDVGEPGAWEEVASLRFMPAGGMAKVAELMLSAAVLQQAGISIGWDPMPPDEESNPWNLPYTHRLLVPAAHAPRARALLAEFYSATPMPEDPAGG
jgi:2-amino-4-hydroxy-6-hydroxymethyldihydropteridine diphosphokinase